jgi:hypothetical protein
LADSGESRSLRSAQRILTDALETHVARAAVPRDDI